MRKRTLIAVLAGFAVFSGVYAMAASLGGITSTKVGADDIALTSCDTDGVSTGYSPAWDTADKRYEISTVTVSGINNACDGQTANVTVTDSTGAQIGVGSLAIPTDGASTSVSVSLTTAASAKAVEGVHVLIAS